MIALRFGGWFQSRLATDPDPYDEPRGVSGYVHAFADEPDLDRVISFQPPAFIRSHGPGVGVRVDRVEVDGVTDADHALLGAPVDLLGRPRFEGRNGVVADDGFEPIHPFTLEIATGGFRLVRSVRPRDPAYPYPEYLAGGVEGAPGEIREATGVTDLRAVWQTRRTSLRSQLASAAEPARTGITERLEFLDHHLAVELRRSALRFFGARMRYEYELSSDVVLTDPEGWLPEAAVAGGDGAPPGWPVSFWLGGWDADVLCGYARGVLGIGVPVGVPVGEPPPPGDDGGVTDRRP